MDSPLFWAIGHFLNRSKRAASSAVAHTSAFIEQRASQAGRLIFMATGGQVVRSEVRYEDLAKEGYENNPVVYRCVRMIADALKSMPLLVFQGDKDVSDTHELSLLFEAPNPEQTWDDLVDAFVGHMVLSGEAFFEGITLGRSGRGQLAEIQLLRPDKMEVDPAPDGTVRGYIYNSNGGKVNWQIDAKPDRFRQIMHVKSWHPRDHWRGLPWLQPATSAGDEHNLAVSYAKSLYENAARPSGALSYEPKEGPSTLSEDQFDKLKADLAEQHQGAKNAGRPLLLEGGLKWQAMGFSPKDMESSDGRNQASREIAFTLGVPPLMLGIKGDNTFANYEEAKLAFWQHTIWPLAILLQKKLTAWVRPLYPDVRIRFDQEGTPIAQAELKAKWDRVRQADFLTMNEKREAVGYDKHAQGDVILVNASLMPLDQVIAGNQDEPGVYDGFNGSDTSDAIRPN